MGPPAFTALRFELADGVATVTLDRPAVLNALDAALKRELLEAFRLAEDPAVRAVILTGAGRAFCAGQDLREGVPPEAIGREVRERYNPIVRAMRALPKPIVAAVNGIAAGAGVSLALAADLRVAAESASFSLAFLRIGLVVDSGASWLLPRLVGAGRAAELVLGGEPVGAAEAERIGLVGRVVPDDHLADAARELALRLAALPPVALALAKRQLAASAEVGFDDALELEADAQAAAGATEDAAEGLAAFREKRPPRFTGR